MSSEIQSCSFVRSHALVACSTALSPSRMCATGHAASSGAIASYASACGTLLHICRAVWKSVLAWGWRRGEPDSFHQFEVPGRPRCLVQPLGNRKQSLATTGVFAFAGGIGFDGRYEGQRLGTGVVEPQFAIDPFQVGQGFVVLAGVQPGSTRSHVKLPKAGLLGDPLVETGEAPSYVLPGQAVREHRRDEPTPP